MQKIEEIKLKIETLKDEILIENADVLKQDGKTGNLVYELYILNNKLLDMQKKSSSAFLVNEIYQKSKTNTLLNVKLSDKLENKLDDFAKEITKEDSVTA